MLILVTVEESRELVSLSVSVDGWAIAVPERVEWVWGSVLWAALACLFDDLDVCVDSVESWASVVVVGLEWC